MRLFLHAVLLGTLLCAINHAGVLAGMLDPPAGYVPAHFIRNLDVPQYLTWAELSKQHGLLPDYHAPWLTEPALFQPMFWIVGHTMLPMAVSYYLFQILTYWLAALALLQAARTFCETRRQMFYSAAVVVCSIPLLMLGWVAAMALGWSTALRTFLGLGVVHYAYDTADGLVRGGLSNSITLTFGTAMTLFAFTNLARYIKDGQRRHYLWLVACVFFDGLFHPFEIFLITTAAVWPLWRAGKKHMIPWLFAAASVGMSPYVIQTVRSSWVRDASDLAQWTMGSPAWVLLAFGIPAAMVCWLMLINFRVKRPEDGVLQSWFLCASLLPMIPVIPVSSHLFDGFVYCLGFLLVRKATEDRLISRLFATRPRVMRFGLAGWVLASAAALGTMYAQVWKEGKSPEPDLFLSAVAPLDEVRMIDWMRASLPHQDLVLAPSAMAPWVATIPMPSFASHDLFSISYNAQQDLSDRFYKGENLRRELIDNFGVSYVVVPKSTPLQLEDAELVHEEASLRLYHIPNQHMQPYPGAANIAGSKPKNAFRQWILRILTAIVPSNTATGRPRA